MQLGSECWILNCVYTCMGPWPDDIKMPFKTFFFLDPRKLARLARDI